MTVHVRADGGSSTGLGHVMRSMALAEAAVDRGLDVVFVTAPGTAGWDAAVAHGFSARPVDGWLDAVEPGDVVHLDGYDIPVEVMHDARARRATVVLMDDGDGAAGLPVDVVVNQNLVDARYDVPVALVGPSYALIRREFRARRRLRGDTAPDELLVTMGGSDAADLAGRIVAALDDRRPFAAVSVLQGPASPSLDAQRPWLRPFRTDDVAGAFDAADAVLSAGGGTTWELLCMGVPAALVEVADNQRFAGRAAAAIGAALFVGRAAELETSVVARLDELTDPAVRRSLSAAGMDLVDGGGAGRVLDAIASRRT